MTTQTGKIQGIVGFSMDKTNTVRRLTASEKHQQLLNLERMKLNKSTLTNEEIEKEMQVFEASLIQSKEDFYDIQTD